MLRLSAARAIACAIIVAGSVAQACAAQPAAPSAKVAARPAQVLEGRATVIDGDGLEIGGVRIRLFGIDAPEADQYCERPDDTRWRCGHYATVALDRLAAGKTVHCTERDRDRYRRSVAVCAVDGGDVAAALARDGWAFAYRRYSEDYVDEEETAKKAKTGVWSGRVEAPWEYRQRRNGGATR